MGDEADKGGSGAAAVEDKLLGLLGQPRERLLDIDLLALLQVAQQAQHSLLELRGVAARRRA